MAYRIVIGRSAEKEIRKLPSSVLKRVVNAISELSENPRPDGCKKLKGSDEELWRIRIGDYRVLYFIEDEVQLVDIQRVRHRKDVYDK